jgi:hypothetical protein
VVVVGWLVADGDLVTGVPKKGFKHSGCEIIIDPSGTGSIVIDPSFVERLLRTSSKTSVSNHLVAAYKRGLEGAKAATEFLRTHRREFESTFSFDPENQSGGGGVLPQLSRSSSQANRHNKAMLTLGIRSGTFHTTATATSWNDFIFIFIHLYSW